MKNFKTRPGIEPAPFQLVTQCFNQLCFHVTTVSDSEVLFMFVTPNGVGTARGKSE
jgi:hypothetical protein